jgi:branched-chain amino acid transport system substrate-binding protein
VILDAQKGTNLKVYVSTFFDENDKSGVAATFVSGFKAWLNADSQHKTDNGGNDIVAAVSALGYDAYMTAIEAIKIANSTTGEDIKNAMPKVSFDGVTGHISFPNGGDAAKSDAFIKQADNGVFKFVKRQSGAS